MKSPTGYQIDVDASDANDAHSEELAAGRLTPCSLSLSSDLSHSPRTSLLSGDLSAPHSAPSVGQEFGADRQQSGPTSVRGHSSAASRSTCPDIAQDVSQADQEGDLTCLSFKESKVKAGAFVDRKLLIRVGMRSQLKHPLAQAFTEGLNDVVDVCEASQLPLKEVSVEVYASTVRGGESDGRDALIQMLLRLIPHLGNLTVASVKFHADDGAIHFSNTAAQEQQSIRMAMPRLHHVRLEGVTTLPRLQIFPLEKLYILEILTEVTEAVVEALPLICSRLLVLVAGPVIPDDESGSDMPGLLGRPAQAQRNAFPSVLRLISAHSCERLLASIPRDSTTLDFTLTNGNCLKIIRKFFDGNPMRSLRLA